MSFTAIPCIATPTGEFVNLLFDVLEREQIRYCVLHGWEHLPNFISSDLDIVIHPRDMSRLSTVFTLMKDAGYRWIQCRNYAGCSFRFDFAWFIDGALQVVGVDIISAYRYSGLALRSGEKLLEGRRRFQGFWIAGPENVFTYLLMKKSLKISISSEQVRELQELVHAIGTDRCCSIATELFGKKASPAVVKACQTGNLEMMLPDLRSKLRRYAWAKNPWSTANYLLLEQGRAVQRLFNPTGLVVAVLGPDGAGKSTLIDQLINNFRPAFRNTNTFHYRARFKKQGPSAPVTNPHSKKPRGRVMSVLRLILLCMEFWVSYFFIVRPKLVRSGFVVFDRYFHDLMVDQLRYRYGGPAWILELVLQFIPKSNLVILVCDAPESVILARKQEMNKEEIQQLRRGYQMLSTKYSNSFLVKTDQTIDRSVAVGTQAVFQYLLKRCCRRYPKWCGNISLDGTSV